MTPPPRILDPRRVPVIGSDDHLPPLPSDRLSAPSLRRRFAEGDGWQPEFRGDAGGLLAGRVPKAAAVLVPLVQRESGLQLLLTRRTDHLRDHAGQISFPGGRCEAEDGSAEATALRETREEVGLAPAVVEIVGRLPVYTTVTGFVVTPVVALVDAPYTLTLDSFEVAEAFEVPMLHLMNPANHRRHVFSFEGGERQFLSMPWSGVGVDGQRREYFIWGATAAMLRNLYRFLGS